MKSNHAIRTQYLQYTIDSPVVCDRHSALDSAVGVTRHGQIAIGRTHSVLHNNTLRRATCGTRRSTQIDAVSGDDRSLNRYSRTQSAVTRDAESAPVRSDGSGCVHAIC